MKKYRTLILGATLVLTILLLITSVGAAPRRDLLGVQPLYDSGWVLTEEGNQGFYHNLDAFPTSWTLLVADDYLGDGLTASPSRDKTPGGDNYGHLVRKITREWFGVGWQANGIGYSAESGYWYQAGDHWARLFIYSADECAGTPPCRP